ncbi:hypothetical protein ACFP3T_02585 [Lactiplantibacillus dongliensis]|uniref:Uncharacterized protein n=1 Tax=Lactiplantibacillus dongliensis TaxID=2559919 RepID=A0ABW1R5V3_9LACO|nr:hypothetical protein [Lactiplantibacillus dongliensis]
MIEHKEEASQMPADVRIKRQYTAAELARISELTKPLEARYRNSSKSPAEVDAELWAAVRSKGTPIAHFSERKLSLSERLRIAWHL